MSIKYTYKGIEHNIDGNTTVLTTSGKYLEDNITIETDGGSTDSILPKNIAGLVMCLDGEINSRAGVHDESINGMQNLVYAPFVEKTSTTGVLEKLNGTPTFTEKSCILGGTMFVPTYDLDKLTFEFCGSFTTNNFDNPAHYQLLMNNVYAGGLQVCVFADSFLYQSFDSNQQSAKYFGSTINIVPDTIYHFAVTDVFNKSDSTKLYIDGNEVEPIIGGDKTTAAKPYRATNTGICGVHSTGTASASPSPIREGSFFGQYTSIRTMRLWNRILTPDEIKQNYLQDKKRFG